MEVYKLQRKAGKYARLCGLRWQACGPFSAAGEKNRAAGNILARATALYSIVLFLLLFELMVRSQPY